MKALRFVKASPWLACYDGEGGDGGAGGEGGEGKGTPQPSGGGNNPPPKAFTQEQLNTFLAEEKKKWKRQADTERQTVMQQLEALKADKNTTEETKAQLEAQLEELRSANMSAEEKAAAALKKAEKEAADKLTAAEEQGRTWQTKHNSLMVGYEITSNFGGQDIVPGSLQFIESYLRPRAKLVENVDEEHPKGNGTYTVKVRMAIKGKDDKPVEVDLTIPEAKKAMMDDVEQFGFIFKATAAGGLGAGNGQPGKKLKVADMSPAQYIEARKKNRASVGLKPM